MVDTYKLFRQRDLLELHLMHAGSGGAKQRTRCEEDGGLHGVGRRQEQNKYVSRSKSITKGKKGIECWGDGDGVVVVGVSKQQLESWGGWLGSSSLLQPETRESCPAWHAWQCHVVRAARFWLASPNSERHSHPCN